VLHYEYQIRSKASEFMNEGGPGSGGLRMSIGDALLAATASTELRQDEFIEKLQLQGGRASSSSDRPFQSGGNTLQKVKNEQKQKQKNKGPGDTPKKLKVDKGGKGGGKGTKGGKGTGKGLPAGVTLLTKFEGKEICFNFNNKATCPGDCGRSHVCQICTGNHPWKKCSKAAV
jgi:hypothetical protein